MEGTVQELAPCIKIINWFRHAGTFLFCVRMVLIYSHITSPRLQYICSFIFKELLGTGFSITIDTEEFKNHDGVKINYSDAVIDTPAFRMEGNSLLYDEIIIRQEIICFEYNGNKAFFRTHDSDFPFDIFSASFYLLTRYEEYLPHEKDPYGRYAHQNSLAFRDGFLHLPLINIWVIEFAKKLKEKFQAFEFLPKDFGTTFNFQPTYDIDIAYSYKHKGLLRNIGGFIKSPSVERIKVLAGSATDPYDSYEWLQQLHQRHRLQPLYFFLVAEKKGKYDKNISPHKDAMWKLVKQHAKQYSIGLHPSWQSGDDAQLLKSEKRQLEAMCETRIDKSRQHFIRFDLPGSYDKLIEAGFTDDYSMGYGSINGFRASVASSFNWYNLEKEEETALRIHPFCFMDANSYYEQKQDTNKTMQELLHYLTVCRKVNGTLTSIWHNNFLGTSSAFNGWRELYERFITQVQQ